MKVLLSPVPGRHRPDRMFRIGRCRHCSVLQADRGLLYRELQKHARPTGSQGKHPEMMERRSPATLCSETESLHASRSSVMLYTCSVIYHMKKKHSMCTVKDVGIPPLVDTVMWLTAQQNIWCYTARRRARLGKSSGPTSTMKAIQDACGASWRGSGQ